MRWESLISIQNLKLAWRRINTGRNLQYKRFFRDMYLVYESAVDKNLHELHDQLKNKVWQPNFASRIYLPKPSGLQRPISLLCIEDQILLQAVSNIFAKKLIKKRKSVELNTVFSNKLAEPSDSIFFTEQWQVTYHAFQNKCEDYFNDGFRWSAHFDLSAYYDTISHDLLVRIVSPQNTHPETWNIVKEWLLKWTSSDSSAMKGHGIPQGPIASDFLAEAFFLPIDIELIKKNFNYIRYVDDIRLFGKTETEIRQTGVMLEQLCRNRGLIPQSKKFEIKEIRTVEDALGALPSIKPSEGKDKTEQEMTADEALKILKSSVEGRPLKVKDKTRFRYVMYRAPENSKFLDCVLKLLPRHPEHIDAFVAYLSNYQNRENIVKSIYSYLEAGIPYPYVRGELWHIMARMSNHEYLMKGLPLAREDAKIRNKCVSLSWGVMHFLMQCEKEGLSKLGRRLSTEQKISRALLVRIFSDKEFETNGYAIELLKGTIEEQLLVSREMQIREKTLGSMGLRQRDIPSICSNSLRALGVIRRCPNIDVDWIAQNLFSLYGCMNIQIWRLLLGTDYEHALQILIEVIARFPGAYSEWLSLQDSFNDIIVRKFFTFLDRKGLSGHSRIVNCNGRLVKYGSLITAGSPFDSHYPNEATNLRKIHERRNKLPGSHPYDEKGGSKNTWLKKKERDILAKEEKTVLDKIASVVDANK